MSAAPITTSRTIRNGPGSMYSAIAITCSKVLILPPRLAAMTPREMTQKRRPVTASSRNRITPVTHHGSSPRADSTTSADPVRALSAIGSAILPKSVIRLRRRASSPSRKSVAEASPNVTQAAIRRTSPPDTSRTTNKGTRPRRSTVSAFAMLIKPGGGTAPASGPLSAPRIVSPARLRGFAPRPPPASPSPFISSFTVRVRCARRSFGQQVGALAAGHRGPDQVAHGEAAGGSHLRGPVDLRGLVRGAPGVPPVAVLLLDEHIQDLARAIGGSLGHELVGQVRQILDPPRDLVGRQLAGQRRRLGAVLVGIPEDPDGIEPGVGEESVQLLHVGLGLPGETHDEIGPDAGLRARPPDVVEQRAEALAVTEPAHRPQYAAAGVLEGKVEVRSHVRGRRHDLDETGPELGGLEIAHAHPLDSPQRREVGKHRLQQPQVAQVLPVGGGVLADQDELAHALGGQPGGLGDQVLR